MVEPKSSATILALADLADLSAKQLEDGQSVEDVIVLLRNAAQAVRSVLNPAEESEEDAAESLDDDHVLAKVDTTIREIENISA